MLPGAISRLAPLLLLPTLAVAPAIVRADPVAGPSDTAELGYVVTTGNSESSTFGLKNTLSIDRGKSSFEFKAGGVRAQSTSGSRRAVGTPGDFEVIEPPRVLSAESYFANTRYGRHFSERVLWSLGAGWDRNRFAGIENRYSVAAGFSTHWIDREELRYRTEYAATYTRQEDVLEVPGGPAAEFLGARLSSELMKGFGQGAKYGNTTIVDENLDDTSDLRVNMTNSLSVAINNRLALKVSLQWLYDHQPSFVHVDLENPPGTKTGEQVDVRLDTLDSIFTASMVVNF
jgi:putative salt-induced outer membrane protein YdiY